MNTKNIVIGLIIFIVITCVCPLCFSVVYFGLESTGNETLKEVFSFLILAALCGIPLVLALGGAGWQIRHTFRSRVAGRKLAEAMGLEPLNQATKQMAIWYGGEYQGHRFAIKPFGSTYSYYAMERSRTGVKFLLRIVLEVQVSEPMDVVVYRGFQGASKNPQNFDEAFDLENAGRLTSETQAAMFDFIQKGYRTGLTGVTLRTSKGTRNLRLSDRATAPKGLLAPEVLPDTHVILVHDHPDTTISAEALQALLDDMEMIARLIEKPA